MKKNYFLLLVFFALSFFFISCSTDDEVVSLNLSDSTIKMYSKGTHSFTITQGNGGYTAISSDEEIATVSIKDNLVAIKGNKVGEVTVTVSDKENKIAKINVTLFEEKFKYKVVEDASIYLIEGEIDEDDREAIKENIPTYYFAETGGSYEFLRNNIYTGDLLVYPTESSSSAYSGVFTAAKDMMRLNITEPEKEFIYYGIKYNPVKSSEAAIPFSFLDDMILIIDCTEYYKGIYPKLKGVAFGQRIQRVYND